MKEASGWLVVGHGVFNWCLVVTICFPSWLSAAAAAAAWHGIDTTWGSRTCQCLLFIPPSLPPSPVEGHIEKLKIPRHN